MIQGGAGTSTNINVNEVIANRALEILGHERGQYAFLHPNDDVNCSQSTNDAYPTALKLGVFLASGDTLAAMAQLQAALREKGEQFSHVIKMGRTQLQDAVPMTLGQEFTAYAAMVRQARSHIDEAAQELLDVSLGATAIGTGITSPPGYAPLVTKRLAEVSGVPVRLARNRRGTGQRTQRLRTRARKGLARRRRARTPPRARGDDRPAQAERIRCDACQDSFTAASRRTSRCARGRSRVKPAAQTVVGSRLLRREDPGAQASSKGTQSSAQSRGDHLSRELARTGIGDEDPAAIRVASLDESHPVLGVGEGRHIVGEQTLRYPLQFCLAVGGPHEVLDTGGADTWPPRRSFGVQVDLKAARCQQQRRVLIVQGNPASEHVAVEVDRSGQVGDRHQ
jgi:hypothetical protein